MAAAKIAVLSQLEYRVNFAIDAVVQPILTALIEVVLWAGIVSGVGGSLGGFSREYYLAYAMWANFVGRATTNWMYEFIMLDSIDTGKVNSILVRPISFYEYYLSQFIGYKLVVAFLSFIIPLVACLLIDAPMRIERLPATIGLICFYLVFIHTVSFCVACLAFFINRASSFTGIKNVALWVLAGELIPLDLYPEPLKSWLLLLPFSSGVYVPVGYLTGRFGNALLLQGFCSVACGIAVFGVLGAWIWRRGLRSYAGTGA